MRDKYDAFAGQRFLRLIGKDFFKVSRFYESEWMRESLVTGLAEEVVKAPKADWENVGQGLDDYATQGRKDKLQVNQEMKSCYSIENIADEKVGKECRERKKRKFTGKEKIAGGKVEFVGRVLRSRSASTLESRKIGCEFELGVGGHYSSMVVSSTNYETNSLDKSPQVMKTDSDDSGVVLESMMKRKSGRPPKVNVESESTELPNVAVVTETLNEGSNVVKATVKCKRGRPRKVNVEFQTTELPNIASVTETLDEGSNVAKAIGENSCVISETTIKRKRGRPPKIKVESETTEPTVVLVTKALDESLSVARANTNNDDSDVIQVTEMKRNPRRPHALKVKSVVTESEYEAAKAESRRERAPIKPEYEVSEANHAVMTNLRHNRGRPTMFLERAEADVSNITMITNSKHKQSRMPRPLVSSETLVIEGVPDQETDGISTTVVDKKKKKKQGRYPNSKPGLRCMLKQPKIHGQSRFHKIQKKAEGKISYFANGNNETSSRKNLVELREKGGEKMGGCGKSMEKHLVREQIKDMLLNAGWTIEYRPRMSKNYNDAVYVSPQGRAYWSVTLAYDVLKSHCENSDAASQKVKPGFTFKPIPEDVMNSLTRTTKKKKEILAKLGLHASDTGRKNSKKSRTTKHSTKNTGSHHEIQSQKFVVESTGHVSRGKSKNAQTKCRRALLVRDSEKEMGGSTTFDTYPGKRMVLNWMIDLGTIPLGVSVQYRGQQQRTRRTHGGWIVRDGIHCGCCNQVVTLSEFEVHARGKSDYPFQYIYLEDGTSLLQCQLLTWNKQDNFQRKGFHSLIVTCDDPNDDSCGICGNGGELICCDGCTSTFHLDCLNLEKFPSGEWHCVYCSCKFCGQVGGGSCQSDVDGFEPFMLSTCRLCEAKYHKLCIQTDDATDDAFISSSFCGKACQEVLNKLIPIIGVKNELKDGYSWTLLHRFDVGSDSNPSEMPLKIICNSKLAVALSIMDECFLPIIDHRTGINLIHNVVYNCGSNFTRLNYSGFYTVILEKSDELISAASVRVHGDSLAEMPFIGTRHNYRRQGMCSRLLGAVEDALGSFGVKKLVIPAISELLQTWTSVFGFKPLRADERQNLKNVNLLVFPCTDMLQKTILGTSKEQELVLHTDDGFHEDAAGVQHVKLDPKSCDEHVTSYCNEGVSHLAGNMDNQDLDIPLEGFLDHKDHLSVEATAQIAQKFHEVPFINAGYGTVHATLVVPDPSNDANHARADSATSTSFHSADDFFCTD